VYRREGDNLIMTVDVNLCEALCGVLVRVDTLDDRLFHVFNVHVVQPGYEKVVPGEGMPVFGETGEVLHLQPTLLCIKLLIHRILSDDDIFHKCLMGTSLISLKDRKGDLIIRFKVKYPNKLTQDQKEKLKSALDPKNQVGGSVYDKKPPVTFHVSNKCFCPDDEDVTEAEKEKMMMRKKISSGNESSKKKRDIMGFEVAGEM
jgi:DnaJ-class molecular chaperone